MKKLIAITTLPLLLAACQSTGGKDSMTSMISAQDLQHHNWVLTQIDGDAITTPGKMQPPHLEIGENLSANGNAGCNNFFGQAEIKDNKFRVAQMGMTMKMCINNVMETESTFSKVLSDWSEISLTKDNMTLTNSDHSLTFELNDWK